jgi:hypothetical protein
MGHSRTPTQNTAGDGFPADPIDVPEGALDVKRAGPGFLPFSSRLLALTVELGARWNRPHPEAGPAGGAVKAGPLGPPVGAALTVPGVG